MFWSILAIFLVLVGLSITYYKIYQNISKGNLEGYKPKNKKIDFSSIIRYTIAILLIIGGLITSDSIQGFIGMMLGCILLYTSTFIRNK